MATSLIAMAFLAVGTLMGWLSRGVWELEQRNKRLHKAVVEHKPRGHVAGLTTFKDLRKDPEIRA